MDLTAKRNELQKHVADTKALYSRLEAEFVKKGAEVPAEEREKLDGMITAGETKRAELEKLTAFADTDRFVSEAAGETKAGGKTGDRAPARKTWGQLVAESKQFQQNDGREMRPVEVKALYASTDGTGGVLVGTMRDPELVNLAPQRERTVLDLVGQSRTTLGAVEYVEMTSRTNNSAVVPERSGGNFGLKPEGDLAFDLKTAPVKTIAQWVAASRQILQDAPQLRDTIDNELAYMLELELEEQIIQGDGLGNNFTGILNTTGIQSRVHQTSGRDYAAGDTIADTLRRALTDIRVAGYAPDGIALHPYVAEALELTKDGEDRYLNIYDPVQMRIWRTRIVETIAMTDGTALVGAWRLGATLYDRMQTEIRVGEPNDFFLRNAVAILAELRAAFAVKRPLAFEKITNL